MVMVVLLAGACGGDEAAPEASSIDLAVRADASATTCQQLGIWPTDQVSSKAEGKTTGEFDWRTTVYANRTHGAGHVDRLRIELYHPTTGTTPLPRTTMIPGDGRYAACTDCVLIDFDLETASGTLDNTFFARAGTLTVTRADRTPGSGTTVLHGEHVRFDEWNYDPAASLDEPVPSGRCLEVDSFQLSSDYTIDTPDGGT